MNMNIGITRTSFGTKLHAPMEPSPLSLDSSSSHPNPHPITLTPDVYVYDHQLSTAGIGIGTSTSTSLKSDTHDAAMLLASIKKLAVREEETIDLSRMPHLPCLKAAPSPSPASFSELCSVYEEQFEQKNVNRLEGGNIGNTSAHVTSFGTTTGTTTTTTRRARTVSVDSHSHSNSHHLNLGYLEGSDCLASSFLTDALPKEKISLDLTQTASGASGASSAAGAVAQVSPPTSPLLQSYRKGPQGLGLGLGLSIKNKKKRPIGSSSNSHHMKTTVADIAKIGIGVEPMEKKRKQMKVRARPSILRSKEIKIKQQEDVNVHDHVKDKTKDGRDMKNNRSGNSTGSSTKTSASTSTSTGTNNTNNNNNNNHNNSKKILRKKFSWKSYPELEGFLIANREEYLRHSAMNYTMQQKEYNNRLTERLLELASECGYIFDETSFSFVAIRDRIRCYFKSYVQSKKKRGLILGYAARRKGLISEEELEKSAGIKGTIVVPKQSASASASPKLASTKTKAMML